MADIITPITLTPEHELALEQARADNAKARTQLAELNAQSQAAAAEQTALQRSEAERDSLLESKVTFHSGSDVLQLLRADPLYDVRFDPATKTMTAIVDKKRVPLSDALRQFALANETLVDGRSLKHLKKAIIPKARSEMTKAEKIEFLNSHTAEEFGKLRATPEQSIETMQITSLKEWNRLPIATRTKIIAEKGGVGFISRLSRV
jgi:hypothetical protein